VQFHIPKDSKEFGKGPWKCYIVARVKLKQKSGEAFRFGLFNNATTTHMAMESAGMGLAGDEKYHAYGMLFDSLSPGMYFWVSPPGSSAVEAVYVDRIYLIKVVK
jgi:hypothetical protein